MTALPDAARHVLERATLCYLSAPSQVAPHVTPLVFVLDGGRVWATTGRGTTKASLWRREPRASGLVHDGERSLAFRGSVTFYDALDPFTWPASILRGPLVARASARFTLKNARFFAGYARDARRVPLAWTPPGRVFLSVDLEAGAVLDGDAVSERWGEWGSDVRGAGVFGAARGGLRVDRIPEDLRDLVGAEGEGTIGVEGDHGTVVLHARWKRSGGVYDAVVPRAALALADPSPEGRGALVLEEASRWRASKMRGLLLRGGTSVHVPGEVREGRQSLERRIEALGQVPTDPALVRIRPESAVWWRAWASGTVGRR